MNNAEFAAITARFLNGTTTDADKAALLAYKPEQPKCSVCGQPADETGYCEAHFIAESRRIRAKFNEDRAGRMARKERMGL